MERLDRRPRSLKRGLNPTTVGLPWSKPKIHSEAAICLLPESEDLTLAERLAAQMEQVSCDAIQTLKMTIDKSSLVSARNKSGMQVYTRS